MIARQHVLAVAVSAALLAVVFCAPFSHAAPPQLNYLFPAGVQRGQTAEITAAGTFDNWPVKIWTDQACVQTAAGEKKGQLTVSVAADANCGVCWLRVYDGEGASQLRPLIVGTLDESLEAEPNDQPGKPQQVGASTLVNGKLAQRGDVDTFSVPLRQGQRLVASLQANELLAAPMDAVLQIADARGFVLAQNDDARGLDPLIAFQVPADGTYLVRTFAFPEKPNSSIDFAGGEDFIYRLTISTGPVLDHTMPLAVERGQTTDVRLVGWNFSGPQRLQLSATDSGTSDATVAVISASAAGSIQLPVVPHDVVVEGEDHSVTSPQSIAIPVVVSGTIAAGGETDAYRIAAAKGQKHQLRCESHALGFPLDPVLQVVDHAGKVLAANDDASRDQRDARLTFTAPADGQFDVRIRDLHGRGGLRFAYRLTIAPETPGFQLKLAAGQFVAEPGKTLEILVSVNRLAGFVEKVEITAVDLPAGISMEPVTSEGQGATAKEVKLKLTAAEGASSGPLRVVGQSAAAANSAKFSLVGNQVHDQLWLTVH